MGNIVLLDELTINKIAAGEVIERPASVVKEMVENSIDAGATQINIEVQNGGISKIRITDNGKGIEKDDLRIAFERHATSKIRVAEDLETVRTMGFRGEALASIAAIAKIEMISRTSNSDMGNRIVVEGGKILLEEPVGAPIGTTIIVENLFYNTPVRYKFLKKDYTEAGYIEDAVTRIALINTNIAIKLINNGKTIIQTHGNGDIRSVIYNIYGKEIAEAVLDVDYEYEGIRIKGVVGKPEVARSNRLYQQFFVNNRYIKDRTLSAAAEQAFKGMLPIGKFGFLILNIQIAPEKVDVNVHPAKLEVRFVEENKVFRAVMHSIKESLLQVNLIKTVNKVEENINQVEIKQTYANPIIEDTEFKIKDTVEIHENKKSKSIADIFKRISKQHEESLSNNNLIEDLFNKQQRVEEGALDYTKIIPKIDVKSDETPNINQQTIPVKILPEETQTLVEEAPETYVNTEILSENKQVNKEVFERMYEKTFGDVPPSMKPKEENFKEIRYVENVSVFDKNQKYASYKYIGSAFSTYIILEISDELYLIDQHAAHERIMYEKVKKNFYSNTDKDSQLMLVPDIINLTHKEMLIARENLDIFEKAGFVVDEFGENTIKLSGVPNICIELDTKSLFLDVLDEIDTVARTERQEIEEKFIATVACKSAVKANTSLTFQEVNALMEKLLTLPNPFTCPHGRPTAIKMTKADIEKKFSRR